MPLLYSHFLSLKLSPSASLLFLLLLAGPTVTGSRVGSGVNDKGGEGDADREFRNSRISRTEAAAGRVGEERRETDAATGFKPMRSMGEGGVWEPRTSSRCVPIPSNMALCQRIGYNTMRMPNLLGHESPAEAVQQSASWLPLLARQCHPDARIFLCSLFAPLCLERIISPCKSLCESVRETCAPIMSCYGYPWPEILHCDQYPADHLLCISSITNSTFHTAGGRKVPQASCRDCELEAPSSSKDVLDTFCRSDFVVKLRLTRLKHSQVSLAQFSLAAKLKVLKHGPLLGGQIRSRIELWLERDVTCVRNMTRQHPHGGTFLVMGTVQGERLVVNKAYIWQRRDKSLTSAARKWKNHRCRR
ncbi:secreted frizzled-related protein 5 [Brachionichthys hirsutus]|uniref:secreted frizzled-related protein 5 n=1 Tax=Brachionichthys hirsutus TaxID=412623 RepID=UPI003605210A